MSKWHTETYNTQAQRDETLIKHTTDVFGPNSTEDSLKLAAQ